MDGGSIMPVLAGTSAADAASQVSDGGDLTGILLRILLLIVLIAVNAFFAATEIAVISVSEGKVRKMAEEGGRKAKRLLKFIDNPAKFLATIQVGVTFAGLMASASAAKSFVTPVSNLFCEPSSASRGAVEVAVLIGLTLLLSFLMLVFGELVPKRIAMQKSEKLALAVSGVVTGISKIFAPFVWLLTKTTNGVLRVCGIDPNLNSEEVTEEEIRIMVEEGEEAGVVEQSEKEMIDNVFELNDIRVSEIMTHRTEIEAISVEDGIDEAVDIAIKEGYSRIPVYDDTIDDIIGVLYVKDLLKFVTKNAPKNFNIKTILRPVYFVPDTNTVSEVLRELQSRRQHIAVVLDEYGGTAGIVTMEDLLEAIVGSIQDEYDNEDEEIVKVDESVFVIDGASDLEEVSESIGVELPEGEYSTVGGMLIDRLDRVPDDGETPVVEFDGLRFEVLKIEDHRIQSVRITKLPEGEEAAGENE